MAFRGVGQQRWVLLGGLAVVSCASILGIEAGTEPDVDGNDSAPPDSGATQDTSSYVEAGGCVGSSNDPNNCGTCGHSCLGGQCLNGLCGPVSLVTGQTDPGSLTDDATHVYWTASDGGTGWVGRAEKAGDAGGPFQVLAISPPKVGKVRLEGNTLYWSILDLGVVTTGMIVGVDKFDGGNQVTVTSGQATPKVFAVDTTQVFFAARDTKEIYRVRRDGTAPPVLLAANQVDVNGIEVDDDYVYWITWDPGNSAVRKALKDGGSGVIDLQTGLDPVGGLAMDPGFLYFTSDMEHTIRRVDKTGGQRTIIHSATDVTLPTGIGVDDGRVFWATFVANIASAAKGGGDYRLLLSDQPGTWGLVVDSKAIYWSRRGTAPTFNNGMIQRLAK